MSLLRRLVLLPLAPVEGVIWLAEVLEQQAEEELARQAPVRDQLAELDDRFVRGQIDEEERRAGEERILAGRAGAAEPTTVIRLPPGEGERP